MKALTFLLLYAMCAAVDAGLTRLTISLGETSEFTARLLGSVVSLACFISVQRHYSENWPVSPLLAGSIGAVSTLVSYGLFALLLSRNPLLQWYVPFLAATLAALILCCLGYRRASKMSSAEN